jgi:hypothetical protein
LRTADERELVGLAQFAVDDHADFDVVAVAVGVDEQFHRQDVPGLGLGDALDLKNFAVGGAVFA